MNSLRMEGTIEDYKDSVMGYHLQKADELRSEIAILCESVKHISEKVNVLNRNMSLITDGIRVAKEIKEPEELFSPFAEVEFPRKLLFIGSGETRPPDEWLSMPSIRFNTKTVGDQVFTDKYEGNEIFGFVLNRYFIGPVAQRLKEEFDNPYCFIFNSKKGYTTTKALDDKTFIVGTRKIMTKYRWFYDLLLCNRELFGFGKTGSTGFFLILWLLYADVDEIYISGFDGYTGASADGYKTLDGEKWPKVRHNLSSEWLVVQKAIEAAKNRGVKVFVVQGDDAVTLDEMREIEKDKYVKLYSESRKYGHGKHFRKAKGHLREMGIKSVCDVGAGKGDFCRWMVANGCEKVYGIDIACDIVAEGVEWHVAPAHQIPLSDKAVEWVTSFDMMEHLLPQEVDEVLDEFKRVATKGMFLSIAYIESSFGKEEGLSLHMTVREKEWWLKKLRRYGAVTLVNNYIKVNFEDDASECVHNS